MAHSAKKKAALASEAVKWLLDQVVFEVFHSACIDSAVAKGGQPRQHTTDEVRERKNVATRANRQAAKSTIIVNTPNTQRQERAGVQRARRRIEAIWKRKAEADREQSVSGVPWDNKASAVRIHKSTYAFFDLCL